MKDVIVSKCEREFIKNAIACGKRLDGRHTYDYRQLKLSFGLTRGSCQVHLGQTKVFVQVSCDVVAPKPARPNEGQLFLNVELSPMAAPNFETGRLSVQGLEITRLLERCILDSRAVDRESLCIVAGEKVWAIRIDVHVLNHDGNIIDCASIAVMSALSHFRRPDVTISGEEVTIHSLEDRHSVPLSIHHIPIIITFSFFENGNYLIVDPTEREEQVMEGKMIVGMNAHREICTLHVGGTMSLQKDQIFRCTQIASGKAAEIIEIIKKSLESDAEKRSNNEKTGFVQLLEEELITTSKRQPFKLNGSDTEDDVRETIQEGIEKANENTDKTLPTHVNVLGKGTAEIGLGGLSTWTVSDSDDDDLQVMHTVTTKVSKPPRHSKPPKSKKKQTAIVDLGEDSEEEAVIILDAEQT